jgi:hypothetical protein
MSKNLSDKFTVHNSLKTRRCFITIAFQLCFEICHQEGPRETGRSETEWDTSAFGLWLIMLIFWKKTYTPYRRTQKLY